MLQVVSACMNSSVKCLGDLNLTGSQACGKVCCEVNWTQGLKPSHLEHSFDHPFGSCVQVNIIRLLSETPMMLILSSIIVIIEPMRREYDFVVESY